MDRSIPEEEGKKKVTELNIFLVPLSLGEIKENITINTNTPSKSSKEQIINQAFKFHLQGNISEATKCYQKLINKGCNDHRVLSNYGAILRDLGKLKKAEFLYRKSIEIRPELAEAHYNLGVILSDLGKLQEAELSYRKAIELKPDYAEAYSNLGNILRNLGKLQEAELSYRKAIELKPDYAEAYSNLGNIFRNIGKLQEAELSYRKAIEINPYFADAHLNLGNILSDLGQLQQAFDSYLKVIEINPKFLNIYSSITRFLKDSDLSQLNKSKLKNTLNILLEKNDVYHNELLTAFHFLYSNEIINILEKVDSDFSEIELLINDKVVINALKKIILCDFKLEALLTKVRRKICDLIAKDTATIDYSKLQFIIALGEQCFLNEYVYSLNKEENISVNTIIQRCKDGEINEINIAILSCYSPLYTLLDQIPSLKSFDFSNQSLNELIELQITEPLQEIELSQNIKKIGSIKDDISQKVQSQYEENPYPRWRYGNYSKSLKLSFTSVIDNDIQPNYINQTLEYGQLKVLIAGCGTGKQILQAQKYKNAQITAIDISLSSLSYAQRKINELGIDNVELIQMDILEVSLLEEKFDIILCSGVLVCMKDPNLGLKKLLGVLKNTGFLKLGLYSELARKDIVKARNYITNRKLKPNKDNIRNIRQKIISGELSDLNTFKTIKDFYSVSECRDLCFHAKEHRFTINQFQEMLQTNELKFLGFFIPKSIKSLYNDYFPEDKTQTNLQNWAKFEEKHTKTFRAMYQFWVCKRTT